MKKIFYSTDSTFQILTLDLDLQKIGQLRPEPILMQKIRAIGPTVRSGEALEDRTDRHIRKQYIWMLETRLMLWFL